MDKALSIYMQDEKTKDLAIAILEGDSIGFVKIVRKLFENLKDFNIYVFHSDCLVLEMG